jgi:hypothetical protein
LSFEFDYRVLSGI